MLCFHKSAMILTPGIQISVTIYLKGEATKSTCKTFYWEINFASVTYL